MNKIVLILIVTSIFISCGKQGSSIEVARPPAIVEPTLGEDYVEFLRQQSSICPSKECPEALAKIVVFKDVTKSIGGGLVQAKFCTGALINSNTIVTSASCLGDNVLKGKHACAFHVHAIFESTESDVIRIKPCAKLLANTSLSNIKDDKAEMRDDFAYIRLGEEVDREILPLASEGFTESEYDSWSIQQVSKHEGLLVQQRCSPLFNSYMNPFAVDVFSPFVPFGNCEFFTGEWGGSAGAIMINHQGFTAGIVSSPVDSDMIEMFRRNGRLLDGEVSDLVHVTNAACLVGSGNADVIEECRKDINYEKLAELESEMVHNGDSLRLALAEVSSEITQLLSYFGFKVDFELNNSADNKWNFWYEPRVRPTCLDNYMSWINQREFRRSLLWKKWRKKYSYYFTHPNYKVEVKFDKYLRTQTVVTKLESVDYALRFSPKELEANQRVDVRLKIPPVIGEDEAHYEYFNGLVDCQL